MTPRNVAVGGGVIAFGMVFLASLSANYQPLLRQAHLRYLESRDRAPWQIEQREAADRAAAEQAARAAAERERQRQEAERQAALAEQRRIQEAARQAQIAAEAERQRLLAEQERATAAQSYPKLLAEYSNAAQAHRDTVSKLLSNIAYYEQLMEGEVKDPDAYRRSDITIAEATARDSCELRTGLERLFDTQSSVLRLLRTCLLHYASDKADAAAHAMQHHIITATAFRLHSPDTAQYLAVDDLVFYVWRDAIADDVHNGRTPHWLPALVDDGEFNDALLKSTVDRSFARRLLDTMTPEENFRLRDTIYPDLTRLEGTANALVAACRTLARTPCGPDR